MDNNLDKLFKNKLDRELEFSGQEDQWSTLEKRLVEPKKNKWLWVFVLIPIAISLIIGMQFIDLESNQQSENLTSPLNSEIISTTDDSPQNTEDLKLNLKKTTAENAINSPFQSKNSENKRISMNTSQKLIHQGITKNIKNNKDNSPIKNVNQSYNSNSSKPSSIQSESSSLTDTLESKADDRNDIYSRGIKNIAYKETNSDQPIHFITHNPIKTEQIRILTLPDYPLIIYSTIIPSTISYNKVERKFRASAGVRNFWYDTSEIKDTTTSSRLIFGLAYQLKKNLLIGASFYKTNRYLEFTSNSEAYNIEFDNNDYENATLLKSEAEYLAYHADIFAEYRILNKGVFGLSPKVGFRLSRYSKAIEYHTVEYNYVRTVIQENSDNRNIHFSRLILGLTGSIEITDRIGVLFHYEYLPEIQSPFIKFKNLQSIKGEVYYWF